MAMYPIRASTSVSSTAEPETYSLADMIARIEAVQELHPELDPKLNYVSAVFPTVMGNSGIFTPVLRMPMKNQRTLGYIVCVTTDGKMLESLDCYTLMRDARLDFVNQIYDCPSRLVQGKVKEYLAMFDAIFRDSNKKLPAPK